MKKLLVICGPTAMGKTSLGVKLAKKFNGEIVSADSRQVYKGMDIGTGKDINKFSIFNFQFSIKDKYQIGHYKIDEVRVWLLDVVKPDYQFSVADYVKCANLVIKDIWKRKKLPILVGGTGFYIKGLVDGIETIGVEQDWELREKLTSCRVNELTSLLKKLDPEKWERMNESDRRNPRRLIRAIEIALQIRNPKSEISNPDVKIEDARLKRRHKSEIRNSKFKTKNTLFIGLTAENNVLYQRIDKRVEERVKQDIVKEIKRLIKMGYSWENSVVGTTIGYREWKECFAGSRLKARAAGIASGDARQGSRLKEEIIQKWKYAEHGYARRQMTWFKKDKRISWFDISKKGWENDIMSFLRKPGYSPVPGESRNLYRF